MNTKLVLASSAVVLGLAGIAGTFAPVEILRTLGVTPDRIVVVLVQVLAALLFAFAMVNWTSRGSLIGGIYNRPVAIGNMTHFVIGALALVKVVLAGSRTPVLIGITVVYAIFAIAFSLVFFRSPVDPSR